MGWEEEEEEEDKREEEGPKVGAPARAGRLLMVFVSPRPVPEQGGHSLMCVA